VKEFYRENNDQPKRRGNIGHRGIGEKGYHHSFSWSTL